MARGLENSGSDQKGRNDVKVTSQPFVSPYSVRCIDCQNALPWAGHPSMVGCSAGEPPPLAGKFWATDRRGCRRFRERDKAHKI